MCGLLVLEWNTDRLRQWQVERKYNQGSYKPFQHTSRRKKAVTLGWRKEKIQAAQLGIEPRASHFADECSNHWAIVPHSFLSLTGMLEWLNWCVYSVRISPFLYSQEYDRTGCKTKQKKTNVSHFGIKPFGSHINLSKKARFPFLTSVALTMITPAKESIFFQGHKYSMCAAEDCIFSPGKQYVWAPVELTTQLPMVAIISGPRWLQHEADAPCSQHIKETQSKHVDCWHSSVAVQIPTETSTACLGQWLLSCTEQQRLLQHWNYHLQSKILLYLPSVFNTV